MTSVKDSCPNCHEWINRCTCPPDQPCDCVSDHHSIDISDGPCGCDCHLKPKPETLGFEREAKGSVGSPAYLYLIEFGSQVWNVFGGPPYQVGSSLFRKRWRDVDVRMILDDAEWTAWGLGEPKRPNAKWSALCMAFSELGKRMTGLPIDFQIQQQTDANERFPHQRNALGLIELRRKETP